MDHPPQLKKGSRGQEVAMLRELLGLPAAPAPAHFDDATHQAVLAFQRRNQLMADGIVGPQTWFALGLTTSDVPVPQQNGTVTEYRAVIRVPLANTPRIYYVNGIRTDGATHAQTSYALSALTNHVVHGVFNATWSKHAIPGFTVDLGQCVVDWVFGVTSKTIELRDALAVAVAEQIRKLIGATPAVGQAVDRLVETVATLSPAQRQTFCAAMFLGNRATAALYNELRLHEGEEQIVVAHSQGNLITANALWALTINFGRLALRNVYVYSLASPAPAWPLGIRQQLRAYHHANDPVIRANPHNWVFIREHYARAIGDYAPYDRPNGLFDPHYIFNFGDKAFAHDIRSKLGLTDIQGWTFPK